LKLLTYEGPIHSEQVARRLVESVGISRVGSRISQRFEQALKSGSRQELFYYKAPFLYADEDRIVPLRDRSGLAPTYKKIEYVPPEEIAGALKDVVSAAFTIERSEAVSASLALLGFQRATQKAATYVETALQQLLDENAIVESGGCLSANGSI